MNSSIVGARSCTMREGTGDKIVVNFRSGGKRTEGGFGRESIGGEPGEERSFAEETSIRVLGGVCMCVWVLVSYSFV